MDISRLDPGKIEAAKRVRLLLLDCDGVLTDGRLYFNESGETLKVFHARDGQGIVDWHKAGFRSGIISGRSSKIVDLRGGQLGDYFTV
jgi:3-deoxy-D-manno-octulosonate 8-phosphate phosphatase (KDO 8-P phosphatase)